MWNPRGGELFYRVGNRLVVATLSFAPEPRVVRRDTLSFVIAAPGVADRAVYDISPDGQRFVTAKPADGMNSPIIALGWLDEVREKLRQRR